MLLKKSESGMTFGLHFKSQKYQYYQEIENREILVNLLGVGVFKKITLLKLNTSITAYKRN